MKKITFTILLSLVSLLTFADSGQWTLYLSYNGAPQDIESADKFIYVQVNNSLYSYNRNDHSIYAFSRQNLLSDIEVQYIAWAKAVKKLVVVYTNGNIDLLCKDATERENIADYYLKTTTDDKTINSIYVKDNLLLLATNFGIVKIDTKKAEIMETYSLQKKFQKTAIDDKFCYALTADGATLYKGDRTKNLIDPKSWTTEAYSGQVDFSTDNDKIKPEDEAIVQTLHFEDSPKSNIITRLLFDNNTLYVATGGWREGYDDINNYTAPHICEYNANGDWLHYDDFKSAVPINANRPVTQMAIDPRNPKHLYAATWGNGIYEFLDGKQVANITAANNPHMTATYSDSYVLTAAVCFGADKNLYYLSSIAKEAFCKYDFSSKEYSHLYQSALYTKDGTSLERLYNLSVDSRGLIWFVNNSYNAPAAYCYNPQGNTLSVNNKFVNQDGTSISNLLYIYTTIEDNEGNIWLATNQGPLMLTPALINNPSDGVIQVKVPRNDGTNFADYLLSGVSISCIAIDGAGRKWFSTNGNGVYVISADNMQQIEHFTKENSLLMSNSITDIAINKQTGEVFFATDNGLCSYKGDATTPNEEMTKDNVWAYPNPVSPDYTGDITITGLTLNARIIITTSSGSFVTDGISTGGSFKWDGCDKSGNRVASGIYMVHAATADGNKGVVCKVAIIR
ncbi:MAG: Por secretion system protein [Bacteroidaceae bacterium]|nr:Por secretion system protein [Bacteroidaceae bacterium]